MTTAQEIRGFDYHTRNMQLKVPDLAYLAGGQVTREIPKVGYVARVPVLVKGTFKAAHATTTTLTKSPFGPHALLERIRLTMLNRTLFDGSGFDARCNSILNTMNYRGDQDGDAQVFAHENVVSVDGTTNNIRFLVMLPLVLNRHDLTGLQQVQNEQTLLTCELNWRNIAANTGPYTDAEGVTISDVSITAEIAPDKYSVPVQEVDRFPIRYVFQTLKEHIDIVATGDQTYKPPRANIWTRILWYHVHNGTLAPSSDITNIELSYNESETPFNISADMLRGMNREDYGRDLPHGVFAFDFMNQGIPLLANARDYMNSAFATDVKLISTVASGATLGTGNNSLHIVRQQLVPLTV